MNTKQWCLAATLVAMVSGAACGDDHKGDFDGVGNASVGKDGGTKLPDGGTAATVSVCGRHAVQSDHAIPDMLIVLDKSGSMAPDGNATHTDRWNGSRNAVDTVTAMFDSTVNFGLMTFPAQGLGSFFGGGGGGGGGGGSLADSPQCAAGMLDVPVGPGTGPAIAGALRMMAASGYTPTAATLQAAAKIIGSPISADQQDTSAKYILLVTDGDPNCSRDYTGRGGVGGVAPPDPTARMDTIAAIEALTKQGVHTYVVGFQTAQTDFASVLDQMAAAGGTGQDKHQSVDNGDELSTVFQTLAGMAASCTYHLSMPVEASQITVTVGGKIVNSDKSNGWTLGSDRQTVSLQGSACEAAKKGSAFAVQVDCNLPIGI